MKVLFSGTGGCRVHEVIDVEAVPRQDDQINFYAEEGDGADEEWSVRVVVWLPLNRDYQAYVVVGPERRSL